MKKNKFVRLTSVFLLFVFITQFASTGFAQTVAVKPDISAKIREEGMKNSKIMNTLHFFTDVYGPRLTGSPNLKLAGEWAAKEMKSWGFDKTELEPWDFGHPGWVNERASGFIVSPVKDSLVFEVLSWTPGTKGMVSGQTAEIEIPFKPAADNPKILENPTQEELTAYFNSVKDKVKGKMVLVGKPATIPVDFAPPAKRREDEALRKMLDPNAPRPQFNPPPRRAPRANSLGFREITDQLDKFLLDNQVKVRINDAGREHGQIRAFNNRSYDVSKSVPTIVLRNEDYGRITRLMADGTPVSLEFDIRNQTIPEGTTSYNVIGEITGTEKPDEVIMLGGHLDSWHAATGATDNAIGCAVMMEAARILKAVGVKPRRTIRVALWSGEEQGLLGSQAYVAKHFGSFEKPMPGYEKFGGYFNIDSGTGKARAMTVFGPPEAATVLRETVKPFEDLGVLGAISTQSRNLGGSDHTSFNQAGLPGIGVMQDPIEYFTHTWHTNLDTYERIVEDDVKASAIVVAAAVYELAMRDQMLPRFEKDKMPALPKNDN